MKCLPSGRNCGKPCPDSFRAGSDLVTSADSPPDAETRRSPALLPNRMTPSWFQVPIGVTGELLESANVTAGPPAMAMRLSLPPAVNANDLLSGDQKVKVPPSVPGSGRAVNASRGRSHSTLG